MIRNRMHYAVAAALVASLVLAGCKKKEETVAMTPPPMASEPAPMPAATMPSASTAPLSVIAVDLGNAVDSDNKITHPMSTFGTGDTLYASVTTDGMASNAPLTATWTYQDGQQVGTETKTLSTGGPATTEFHASKPGGWPAGKYKVEVSLNGAVVQSRDFEVK